MLATHAAKSLETSGLYLRNMGDGYSLVSNTKFEVGDILGIVEAPFVEPTSDCPIILCSETGVFFDISNPHLTNWVYFLETCFMYNVHFESKGQEVAVVASKTICVGEHIRLDESSREIVENEESESDPADTPAASAPPASSEMGKD